MQWSGPNEGSAPLLREDLYSRKSRAPMPDCVPIPWHQSSQTHRLVEDPGISSPELLVAADVSLHQSICEVMQSLPLNQGATVGCIYAPDKVNPNIFQFYFDFPDIFHHTSMHPLFCNFYEFYLIFYDFISPFIIYQNYLYLRWHLFFWFHLAPDLLILSHASCPELKSGPCMRS